MEQIYQELLNELKDLTREIKALRREVRRFRSDKENNAAQKIELDSVTVAEAAARTGLSNQMIRKMIKTKKLDSYKDDNYIIRIPISSFKNI